MGLNEGDIRRVVWTFLQAFVAAFLVTAGGWSTLPNYSVLKAAVISAGLAGLAAAFSFLKNLLLGDGSTLK